MEFSLDVRGNKEFQQKLGRLRDKAQLTKVMKGLGQHTENHIKTKEIRASGGAPVAHYLTRRSGGGSITMPHTEIRGSGLNVEARVGMTGKKGELMKFHERGGWIRSKGKKPLTFRNRAGKWFSKWQVYIGARPTFARTKQWASREAPKYVDQFIGRAIKAAGLK